MLQIRKLGPILVPLVALLARPAFALNQGALGPGSRPVIAVVGANEGTETTDFLVSFGVLSAADVADVVAVSTHSGPVRMMPALTIEAQTTIAQFDGQHPKGADYVIIPALHNNDNPELISWLRSQSAHGAVLVSICDGAKVLAATGLLDGHSATAHWMSLNGLERKYPKVHWVRNRRYVRDGNVMSTTGVTASVPASLAIVETIAGHERAADLAKHLGVPKWSPEHDSQAFRFTWKCWATAGWNELAFWNHEDLGIEVENGADEIALALEADALSRTFRSQAKAVTSDGRPIQTKFGLKVFTTRDRGPGIDRTIGDLPANQPPALALDTTLATIQHEYGQPTADWVALQIEYPHDLNAPVGHP